MDPLQIQAAWSHLLPLVTALVEKGETVVRVATRAESARLAQGRLVEELAAGDRTLISTSWVHGRLSNLEGIRQKVQNHRQKPVHERRRSDQIRFDLRFGSIASWLSGSGSRKASGKEGDQEDLSSRGRPGLVVFLHPADHELAIREAFSSGVPVAAVVNTDTPSLESMDYPLPGNESSLSAQLRYRLLIQQAVHEGVRRRGS